MSKPEPMYNLHFLSNITDLNVEEGLRQNGSRRAYFNELSLFESSVRQIPERLLAERPKDELLSDLNELMQKLLPLCDTALSIQIEKVFILIKKDGDQNIIAEKLYKIRKELLFLVKMIKEADTSATDHVLEDVNSIEPEPGIQPEPGSQTADQAKAHRVSMEPHPVLFTTLIKHIEDLDSDAALDELKAISSFSYGDEIDSALERISKNLRNFDCENNEMEVKKIMTLISGGNQLHRKIDKKKILAIDDMPDILNTLKSLLQDHYTVYCATTHLAAFKFLAGNIPDLILVDIEMPEMDGFTLVKILRQMDTCKNTPVLFLTGNVSVENIKTSIESGGNDFIKKPIDYKILMSKIQQHLDK